MKNQPVQHPFTPVKIAIVTGLSDPRICSLTQEQQELMDSIDVPKRWKVSSNFPFLGGEPQSTRISLARASINNSLQYVTSALSGYRELAAPHWESLLQSTDHLLLITGSSGIQIVNVGLRDLEYSTHVEAFLLGPASLRPPVFPNKSLRGSRDFISRLLYGKVDVTVSGTKHMDYWYDITIQEMVKAWLYNRISELLGQEVISRKTV